MSTDWVKRQTNLVLERLLDRDRVLCLLLEFSFSFSLAALSPLSVAPPPAPPTTMPTVSGATGATFCSSSAMLASLTFLKASSTSLLVSEGEGPWGLTIAFLLWFTLHAIDWRCVRERGGERERGSECYVAYVEM